jgi:sugar phosphate isomerase/epimerase
MSGNKKRIYLSSACLRQARIGGIVEVLARNGVRNIELTGGTRYYDRYVEDLAELKRRCALNYIVHNYFPPSGKDFVLNLASSDRGIAEGSLRHTMRAVDDCVSLGSPFYAVHAGFFIDLKSSELGRPLTGRRALKDVDRKTDIFIKNFKRMERFAEDRGVTLYIENNVYARMPRGIRTKKLPFMLVAYDDYAALRKRLGFRLLLDLAHLKISCRTLGLEFREEAQKFFDTDEVEYLHVSENDGRSDSHMPPADDSDICDMLPQVPKTAKTITLEVRGRRFGEVLDSYNRIRKLLGSKK